LQTQRTQQKAGNQKTHQRRQPDLARTKPEHECDPHRQYIPETDCSEIEGLGYIHSSLIETL